MKHKDTVMIMTVYHPKPSHEDEFVNVWIEKICNLAYKMGSDIMGIYHNEDSDEYVAIGQWPNRTKAEEFLHSKALAEASKYLNEFCLIPATRTVYDILSEAA